MRYPGTEGTVPEMQNPAIAKRNTLMPPTAPDAPPQHIRDRRPFGHDQDTAHTRKHPIRPELPPFTGKFALAKPGTPPIPSDLLTELISHGEFTVKRRSLPVAAALAATAALLLTACGSGDDSASDNDKIAGADQGSESPKASASASGAPAEDKPDGVDVSLPKDINLVFDWDKPKGKNEAAAMEDAANYVRAIYRGVDKRTTKDAALSAYSTGNGLKYAKTQIDVRLEGGWTATGTRRHYQATTRSASNGNSVEVAFCVDSTKFYSKEVKTGKVLKGTPSITDFDYFKIIMVKLPTGDGLWQASKVYVEAKAAKCQ